MSTPEAVRGCWLQARARWPDIDVSLDAFDEHLHRTRVQPDALPPARLVELYLALACSRGDRRALRRFETEILTAARAPISRLDSNVAFVDEVLQRTRAKLLVGNRGERPPVARFTGEGSLEAWVTVSAVRLALSMLSRRRKDTPLDDATWAFALSLPSLANAELEVLKHKHRVEVADALRHACGRLSSRDRTVMRLHFVDGLNAREIGRIYAVHRATVNRWLVAAKEELATAVRIHLIDRLDAGEQTVEELTRLVRSQLDVSLSQLLEPSDPP